MLRPVSIVMSVETVSIVMFVETVSIVISVETMSVVMSVQTVCYYETLVCCYVGSCSDAKTLFLALS